MKQNIPAGKKHRIILELNDEQLSELMTQLEARLECVPGLSSRIPSPNTLADVANGLLHSIERNPEAPNAPCHYTALQLVPIYANLLPAWREALQRREYRTWATSDMPDRIGPKHIKHAKKLLTAANIPYAKVSAYIPQDYPIPLMRKCSNNCS